MLRLSLTGALPPQDFHSGGTVCSPTRATVLTGRNHFRDCVDYVYGCSDMTECVPSFNFAPQKTFTVPMAVRAANKGYKSWFGGKVRPAEGPAARSSVCAELVCWHAYWRSRHSVTDPSCAPA